MSRIFRVVAIRDGAEVLRSLEFGTVCARWVKDSRSLSVEELEPATGKIPHRVPNAECLSFLRSWLPGNPHLMPDERKDMEQLMSEASRHSGDILGGDIAPGDLVRYENDKNAPNPLARVTRVETLTHARIQIPSPMAITPTPGTARTK
jgi:hypothetical protein